MQKKYHALLIIVSFIFVSIFSTNMSSADSLPGVDDFDWTFGVCERDASKPLNLVSSTQMTYDITNSVIHVLENGNTPDLWVGASTTIPVTNGILSLSFEAMAISDYIDADRLSMGIYTPTADTEIAIWHLINEPDPPMTEFQHYNRTFDLNGYDEVIIFFYYNDGWIENLEQEFWVKNLVVNSNASESLLYDNYVDSYFVTKNSLPTGVVFYEDYLTVFSSRAKIVNQYDPIMNEFVDSWNASDLNIRQFDTDGTYFYCMESKNSILYTLDTNFNIVDTLSTSITCDGGIAFFKPNSMCGCTFIANNLEAKIYEVNLDTGSVLSELDTPGTQIKGMVYDGTYLWVCDRETQTIFRIFPETNTVIQKFTFEHIQPTGLCYDDDGYLWTTDIITSIIYKLNISIHDEAPEHPFNTTVTNFIPTSLIFVTLTISALILHKKRKREKNL